ncbi:glycosyltransferase [Curtobacterium sp. MCBD17_032]|uniref:glycosyltransferase n=1 Tax=Curtobacterium sp. MCBD17_032 TaxID=2175659 RepID=UPI000DA6F1D8|nr:glycosyltransferase [Curtobacterium sp. MCBD17_032]PZE86196.1 glycosyltransferase family 4 protein [Curtobacterium sp. MCBD17_032]
MSGRGLIVHEWIERTGGAERVLDAFAATHPSADILALWNDHPDRYEPGRVRESAVARTPLRGRKAAALPLMPALWRYEGRRHGAYDWALISSHLFAHHVRVRGVPPERHFAYVHTPARYLWAPELDARGASPAVRAVAPLFRAVDRRRGADLIEVAVNSAFVRERVRRAWGVDARVLHPPVDLQRIRAAAAARSSLTEDEQALLDSVPTDALLGASRFVPYKRLDVVIAAGAATGRPVVVAGCGPDEDRLRALATAAPVEVHFVIAPSDRLLACLFDRAAVLVFPGIEDFGIVPVEALALGTPVVVAARGGARESTSERSGACLPGHDPDSLADAVERAVRLDPSDCRRDAERFDVAHFRSEVASWTAT